MDDKEFVEEFYFLKNDLISDYKPKEATGFRKELVDKLVSNSEQAKALEVLLETIMTDALYTVLLGLDGAAAIGGLQIDYKLHDEDGNELTGKNISSYAGEFFPENDPTIKQACITNHASSPASWQDKFNALRAKNKLASALGRQQAFVMSDIYNSGYSGGDWYALKNAVLLAAMKDAHGKLDIFDKLPPHLRKTEVGDLIYQAVYLGHKKAASKAAKLLTGGSDKSWLILEKSQLLTKPASIARINQTPRITPRIT